ncbi:MAG: FMN-binding glutamate synthase family protein [Rhodospirillales bacterium]|jgi:glutamate synthase domain-containing protein 2|uniref:FMN-binding glutamate synthase family protein n=1 Tax=Hwanghaeella sp. 1Z406 TaxID=3402811 RepID=UPI000C993E0F|nr:FMN-binding glutamate synthase family protein [Rhodospirillales bacterium]|tara:strand:+ start:149940 stop:151511 length:1572 start_codon:yes stop_codon:yes gene_type:complete
MSRFFTLFVSLSGAMVGVGMVLGDWFPGYWIAAVSLPLLALGIFDLLQTRHTLWRNYPIISHMRWLFEGIRPEIRQYLIESDGDSFPFSREQRSLVYQRAKNQLQTIPFGTQQDVYSSGYSFFSHSLKPEHVDVSTLRVRIGGDRCLQPYSSSILNISAMSFGSLSGNAISALNRGAKLGSFAHDTGEGGLSRYHRQNGGDIIWEIGSGYFGCRTDDGHFDPAKFQTVAQDPQVKMIEIKLSQGAKPGHGGMLPGPKVNAEIAEARGVPEGVDCISPASHSAFDTPMGLIAFVARLRDLSGGKPVGFKLCIGHKHEFMAIVKAMIKSDVYPDFIVIDGKEGGTGAAPVEFANSVGLPLRDGLHFANMTLIGAGIRDKIRVGASGKIVSGADMTQAMALGADWCNSARGFMFAIGCIQARACHTNKCPTGVATQDKLRQAGLNVGDKSVRVANFHRNTLYGFAEMIGAMGLKSPHEITFTMINFREAHFSGALLARLEKGQLLKEGCPEDYAKPWRAANPESFR